MKLYLTTDDGELLDSTTLTAEEFDRARTNGHAATTIIDSLARGQGE